MNGGFAPSVQVNERRGRIGTRAPHAGCGVDKAENMVIRQDSWLRVVISLLFDKPRRGVSRL